MSGIDFNNNNISRISNNIRRASNRNDSSMINKNNMSRISNTRENTGGIYSRPFRK